MQGLERRIGTQQIWKWRGRNSESEAICISEREHAEIRLVCLTESDVNNSASASRFSFFFSNEGQLEPTFFRLLFFYSYDLVLTITNFKSARLWEGHSAFWPWLFKKICEILIFEYRGGKRAISVFPLSTSDDCTVSKFEHIPSCASIFRGFFHAPAHLTVHLL